jgi:hypothetical protein
VIRECCPRCGTTVDLLRKERHSTMWVFLFVCHACAWMWMESDSVPAANRRVIRPKSRSLASRIH